MNNNNPGNENTEDNVSNRQQDSGLSNSSRSGNNEHNNASLQQGGTADMGRDSLIAGRENEHKRGSGISTKDSVTGSDYDGQLSGA